MYKLFISIQVFYLFTCVLFLFKNLFIYLFTSIILFYIFVYKKFLKLSVNLQACYLLNISSILFIYQHFFLFTGILFIYWHFICTTICVFLQAEALQFCIGLT